MVRKRLFVLLACLFVSMIGFGITLPVLPFYTERLALAGGASRDAVAIHVGLVTSVYVLMQFFFAPLWGRWSDRVGRRPLILLGITGYAVSQLFFGVADSLVGLYAARIVGGILSSATLPVGTAYVTDLTAEGERGRGMAWIGAATNLGVVVGPMLGGTLARRDLHFSMRYWHFIIDSFSIPFFAAAALAFLTLIVAFRWLPESLPSRPLDTRHRPKPASGLNPSRLSTELKPLLFLALVAQFGMAIFEATFGLYARDVLSYGPAEVGSVFVICGLVMAVFQLGVTRYGMKFLSELTQIALGFILMGSSLALLSITRTPALLSGTVGLLALGMAILTPNLLALISRRGGQRAGAALGAQTAANSLGQTGGPLLGSVLFTWWAAAPYLVAGAMLVVVGFSTRWLGAKRNGSAAE